LSADNVNHRDRRLPVKVQPGAGRNEVAGFSGGVLQIKIAAPPEKGRANRELIDFLSRLLDVRKSAIAIVKGATSRNKLIAVEGLTASEILRRLSI
jgi:uncharacterized protein (TIGR00251 family)